MNDMNSLAITAFGLLPLAIILAATIGSLSQSACDRFLGEEDSLDDAISLARVSGLKHEVWRRIDELDQAQSHGFPAHLLNSAGSGRGWPSLAPTRRFDDRSGRCRD